MTQWHQSQFFTILLAFLSGGHKMAGGMTVIIFMFRARDKGQGVSIPPHRNGSLFRLPGLLSGHMTMPHGR